MSDDFRQSPAATFAEVDLAPSATGGKTAAQRDADKAKKVAWKPEPDWCQAVERLRNLNG